MGGWLAGEIEPVLTGALVAALRAKGVSGRELAALADGGTINGGQAKEVLGAMLETGRAPGEIVKERGLEQVSDTGFLDEIVGRVLAENADAVAKIKAGNDKAINALKGQVMKLSQGKANPAVVGELLAAAIAKS
jgi:aspartyl-tRNA(Asn)/glutamyl-tRNA(Gln) amidotransferase subunit B